MPGLRNASGLNIPIIGTEGGFNPIINNQTLGYTAAIGSRSTLIRYSGPGGVTLAFSPAATLGDGWTCFVRNDAATDITLDPDGGELINGAATLTLEPGQAIQVVCTGGAFYTVGQSSSVDGANQALSNLTNPTAVNQALVPGANATYDMGSGTLTWRDVYVEDLLSGQTNGNTIIMAVWDTGSLTYVPIIGGLVGNPATATIASFVTGTTQAPATNTDQLATCAFVQAAVGGGGFVTSVSGTANRITSTGGATPVIDIAATYVGQASITTVGTVTTGTWNATVIDLAHGGTNANLTASNGGIFYSTGTAGAILAGTATARQMLQSGATAAPAWSTATWPATTTANRILYSSATNVVGEITSAASSVLVTDGSSVPSFSTALPNGVTATTQAPGTNNTTIATTAFVQAAISGASGSITTWCQFDASSGTPTIQADLNVTSLTDNGTGDFTVNFTSAYATNDYAVAGCAGSASPGAYGYHIAITALATTTVRLKCGTSGGGVDLPWNTFMITGG